mgnify:CR=1 FL=1
MRRCRSRSASLPCLRSSETEHLRRVAIVARYKQRTDGEGFTVPIGEVYRIACCDCGLVHDFVFDSGDGKPIGVAARRNNLATGQRRRTQVARAEGNESGKRLREAYERDFRARKAAEAVGREAA